MAITFVNAATNKASSTSATGTLPASIAVNDLLVAAIVAASYSAEPSGWTLRATAGTLRVYTRLYQSGDSAPAWTVGSGNWIVGIAAYRGVDTTTPVRTATIATSGPGWADSSSVTSPSVVAGDTLVHAAATTNQTYTSTPPSGMAERLDTTQGRALTLADEIGTASSGSVTRANTWTGYNDMLGAMFALIPASGGGGSPPAAPSGLTATPASATQVNLSWTDNASDETAFTVERSPAGAGTWSVLSSGVAANATSYSDTTASANTNYDYRVKATNGAGSSSYATATNARTYSGAPTSPGASATSSSAITVSWTAPSGGATSYKVERSTTGTGGWSQIASGVTSTSYGDTGLAAGTTYYYRIRATNATGDGAYSSNASATTSGGGSPPSAPTSPGASALSSSSIRVSWSASAGATSYTVERSPNGTSGWSAVVTGHAGSPYDDTGLSPSTTYYYRVIAVNGAGSSSPSSVASATTSAAGSGTTYAASGSWRWIQVEWPTSHRHKQTTISGTVAGGTTSVYLATSLDGVTWHWFSGPLTSGVLISVASQAAAESAAISLAAITGNRLTLPTMVEARFYRLYFRNSTHATTWREYYPRRLVQADDVEAEAIRAIHISAGAVTADKILVGALDGFVITGATIRTAASGARIEMSGSAIYAVDSGGVVRAEMNTTGFITRDSAGNIQVQATAATDGALTAGGGKVTLDKTGMWLVAQAAAGDIGSTVAWRASGTFFAGLNAYYSSGGQGNSKLATGDAGSGAGSTVELTAERTGSNPVVLQLLHSTTARQVAILSGASPVLTYSITNNRLSLTGDITASGGLNLGTATGAAAGQAVVRGTTNGYYLHDRTENTLWGMYATGGTLHVENVVGGVIALLTNTGNLTIDGTLTESSDARLKRDITRIGSARGALRALARLASTYTRADGRRYSGFIAQDVAAIPELAHLVSEGIDGNLGIHYSGFIPYIVAALGELLAERPVTVPVTPGR